MAGTTISQRTAAVLAKALGAARISLLPFLPTSILRDAHTCLVRTSIQRQFKDLTPTTIFFGQTPLISPNNGAGKYSGWNMVPIFSRQKLGCSVEKCNCMELQPTSTPAFSALDFRCTHLFIAGLKDLRTAHTRFWTSIIYGPLTRVLQW